MRGTRVNRLHESSEARPPGHRGACRQNCSKERRGLNWSSELDPKEVAFLGHCHCGMGTRARCQRSL